MLHPNLDRAVGEAWDPPLTLGVRLVGLARMTFSTVGQTARVRGLVEAG